MARPTKLTRHVRQKLVEVIEGGNTLKDAAAAAGISMSSLERYRAQDEALAFELKAAEARAVAGFVNVIPMAADRGDWRAAAWILERRPEDWGRRERGRPDRIDPIEERPDLSLLSDEQLEQLIGIQETLGIPMGDEERKAHRNGDGRYR